jgi:hypothetical protein
VQLTPKHVISHCRRDDRDLSTCDILPLSVERAWRRKERFDGGCSAPDSGERSGAYAAAIPAKIGTVSQTAASDITRASSRLPRHIGYHECHRARLMRHNVSTTVHTGTPAPRSRRASVQGPESRATSRPSILRTRGA